MPTDSPHMNPGSRRGRVLASVALALVIGVVVQFAAVAKVATGVRHLEQLKAANLAASHGMTPAVTADNFQWAIRPGAMPGTPFERGVLLDIAVGTAEFGIVLFVLAFCRTRVVWMVVPVMFAMFFGYALEKTLSGKPCGCFGALWEPPKGFSLVMDAIFVIAGLGLARWHGVRKGLLTGLIVVSIASGIGGFLYSKVSGAPKPITSAPVPSGAPSGTQGAPPANSSAQAQTKPPHQRDDRPASDRLLASDLLADLRALTDEDPAWYLFIWDPTCPTCEAMRPIVEMYQQQYVDEGNPVLQVRQLMKQDIERDTGIEEWQWTTSPAIVIVRGGKIIAEFGGEGAPFPDAVSDRLFKNEPIDDLQPKR